MARTVPASMERGTLLLALLDDDRVRSAVASQPERGDCDVLPCCIN